MIDFTLSANDRAMLEAIRSEGELARKYARYYDEHEDELTPDMLPGASQLPARHELMAQPSSEDSSGAVIAMLLTAARTWGDYAVQPRRGKGALGNAALHAAGTEAQKERWGQLTLAMAITEPGCGSDTSAIQTSAVLDGDDWVLNGEKIFVTTGVRCEGAVIWATTDKRAGRAGIRSFLVLKGTPGFIVAHKEKKLGIRADDTASFVFQDCRIPRDQLLGGERSVQHTGPGGGYRNVLQTFNITRPAVAALGLGIAQAALDFTREQLRTAGEPVDTFDVDSSTPPSSAVTQFQRLETLHEAAMLTVLRAAWLSDRGQPNNVEASIAKAKGGAAAREITQGCIQLLGPLAISREHLLEKWFRDARITDLYEGTGQIQNLIIARAILGFGRDALS